jgi:hypothetical protein
MVDSAIYPSMAAGYIAKTLLHSQHPHRRSMETALAQTIIVIITLTQCAGTRFLSAFSNTLALLSLAPSLVWMLWAGAAHVHSLTPLTLQAVLCYNTIPLTHLCISPDPIRFPRFSPPATSPSLPQTSPLLYPAKQTGRRCCLGAYGCTTGIELEKGFMVSLQACLPRSLMRIHTCKHP